jgi:chemotaxis protein methyltransferase CheR
VTTLSASSDASLTFAHAVFQTLPLPLLLFDSDRRVLWASRAFVETFEVPETGVNGRILAEIAGGGWDIAQLRVLLDNAFAHGPALGDYETDLVREGLRPRRLQVNVRTVVQDDDFGPRVLMMITDVTQVRQTERLNITLLLEKDSLLRERAILLDEMQHRIANSLQIIASVLMLKARAVDSEDARLHLRDAHSRVLSLAAVQQHLQVGLGEVGVQTYLTRLCNSLASSMIRDTRSLVLKVAADDVTVGAREAVSLGLIVTELVINAIKYAFPDERAGTILVSYQEDGEAWTLGVADDGVGLPAGSKVGKVALGTSIVESLAKQLGALVAVDSRADGVRVTVAKGPVLGPKP